jgi:hypothetical protein
MLAIARALPSFLADWATWWRYRPRWLARHRAIQQVAWQGVMVASNKTMQGVIVGAEMAANIAEHNPLLDRLTRLAAYDAFNKSGELIQDAAPEQWAELVQPEMVPVGPERQYGKYTVQDYMPVAVTSNEAERPDPLVGRRVRINDTFEHPYYHGCTGVVVGTTITWDDVEYVDILLDAQGKGTRLGAFVGNVTPIDGDNAEEHF